MSLKISSWALNKYRATGNVTSRIASRENVGAVAAEESIYNVSINHSNIRISKGVETKAYRLIGGPAHDIVDVMLG